MNGHSKQQEFIENSLPQSVVMQCGKTLLNFTGTSALHHQGIQMTIHSQQIKLCQNRHSNKGFIADRNTFAITVHKYVRVMSSYFTPFYKLQ